MIQGKKTKKLRLEKVSPGSKLQMYNSLVSYILQVSWLIARFCPLFFRAFDLLNSHSPRAMDFKAPLKQTSFKSQKKKMVTLSETLMSLQLPSGKPVAKDGRRMSVISMAFTLKSVAELADALFQRDMCR